MPHCLMVSTAWPVFSLILIDVSSIISWADARRGRASIRSPPRADAEEIDMASEDAEAVDEGRRMEEGEKEDGRGRGGAAGLLL